MRVGLVSLCGMFAPVCHGIGSVMMMCCKFDETDHRRVRAELNARRDSAVGI